LLSFVDFSIADIKVVSAVDNKIHQVDIKVPAWKLIIEYDGTHWHRDKIEQDTDKGLQLNQLGWQVIRIRSTELGKITANDILLPEKSMSDVKTVAEHLTLKLVELGYLQQSDYDSYQARDNLIKAEKAEEYIQQLLAAKRSEDQLELFEVSPS